MWQVNVIVKATLPVTLRCFLDPQAISQNPKVPIASLHVHHLSFSQLPDQATVHDHRNEYHKINTFRK
jgi:hypothetical protein